MTTPRKSRAQQQRVTESRAAYERPKLDRWAPPEAMMAPPEIDGFKTRWIREYVRGEYDDRSMQDSYNEGYRPVLHSEVPGVFIGVPSEDGIIRSGGLILMKIPEEFCQQRKEYYARQSMESLRGANTLQGLDTPGTGIKAFEEDGSRTLEGQAALNAFRGG